MSDLWPVDSADLLSDGVITMVLHFLWRRIVMVVTSLSVVAETVSVLHPKIKALNSEKRWLGYTYIDILDLICL